MNEDGLLSAASEDDAEWLRPNFGELRAEHIIKNAARWVSDALQSQQVVWPAAFDGRLAVPPSAHVLDALTRKYLLFGDVPEWDAEWHLRPTSGTVAFKVNLPRCDVCVRASGARYDAPISRRLPAPHGNLCPWCYQRRSTSQLGTGHGQFLLRYAEIPGEIWDAASRAREVWAERGAPVTDETLDALYRVDPAGPLTWPYAPPFTGEGNRTSREGLLESLLLSTVVNEDTARGLFSDVMSWDDEGALSYYTRPHAVDGISQLITFGPEGTEHLDALVQDLSQDPHVRRRADHNEVRHLTVRKVSTILAEGASPRKTLSRLESDVRRLVGPIVWVAPVGGVTASEEPRRFGDEFLIGRLGSKLHDAISDLADEHGVGGRIDFDYASAWAEDYEAFLEDPEGFEEFESGRWLPVVAVQVIDAVGSVAHHLGFQKIYSLAGAIWAAGSLDGAPRRTTVPWIIGEPGHAGRAQEEEEANELGSVTVYTLRGGRSDYSNFYYSTGEPENLDGLLTGEGRHIVDVVARWSPNEIDDGSSVTRLAASARHARAGLESRDLYFSAFHLVAAMETLLIHGDDPIGKTLARRVAAVLDRHSAKSEVKQLYDLRSKAAHRGLSPRPLADSVDLVEAGWTRLPRIMKWVSERADIGRTMDDVVTEVDALPHPEED